MATATRIHDEPVAPPPDKIILELSEAEASYLRSLTGMMGGTYAGQDAVESIWCALEKVGATFQHDAFVGASLYT